MTCNKQCYYAKGSICKCVCGGINHGIGYHKPNENETVEEMVERTKMKVTEDMKRRNEKFRIKKARTKVKFQTLDSFIYAHSNNDLKIQKLREEFQKVSYSLSTKNGWAQTDRALQIMEEIKKLQEGK